MKVTPLTQGTGVPQASDIGSPQRSAGLEKLARAKAIASGQTPEAPASTGNPQADAVQIAMKKIKMRTNVSPDRPIPEVATPTEGVELAPETPVENPINPTSEPQATQPEETQPLSPQFAALAKQKRALQIERAKLEQEKAELASKTAFDPAEYVSKADLKANPLKVFEAGLTYDDLTNAILQNPAPAVDPVKLREEIKEELKKEFLGEFTARDQQQEQQVLSEIRREAENITAQGDDFETIRQAKALNHPDFSNGKNAVVDLIHRHFKKTGEVMDTFEAAQLIENQLIEELAPFAKIKKVQNKIAPEVQHPAPQTPAQPNPGVKVMRTLTNRDSANPAQLDRRARMLAAWNGTLKRG